MVLDLGYYAFMVSVIVGLICWALSPWSIAAANLLWKLGLFFYGFVCMLLSTDKKFDKKKIKKPEDAPKGETKRIIFIRHGESEWNLIFNKGVAKLLPRLIAAWVREIIMLITRDSVFFDSPLNEEGIKQAKELSEFLLKEKNSTNPDIQALLDPSKSVMCSSTLRRAIATLVACLWAPRLKGSSEKVYLLSCGQEVSRNVDTISLADEKSIPDLHSFEKSLDGFSADARINSSWNYGNKAIFGSGLERLQAFADWAASRPEKVIIIGGHSLWFRYFFQVFLPANANPHDCKNLKVHNTGVVAFDLMGSNGHFTIVPDSVSVVWKGFDDKKKGKKKDA